MPVLTGTDGNDTLMAGERNETISGLAGNDYVYAIAGANSVDGGAGDDTIRGGWDADTLYGGEGNDVIYGDNGYTPAWTMLPMVGGDLISGGAGNDTLFGDTGSASDPGTGDTLDGGDGNDFLDGQAGNNVIDGGSGNDRILVGDGANTIDGGDGIDTLQVGGGTVIDLASGTYQLANGAQGFVSGMETVTGTGGHNLFVGDDAANEFDSGGGQDTLLGGGGNDSMTGSDAAVMDGGDGDDNMLNSEHITNEHCTIEGGAGNDTLTLFGDGALRGGAGNDELHGWGSPGLSALFSGNRSEYVIEVKYDGIQLDGGLGGRTYLSVTDTIADRDGADRIYSGVTNLQFADGSVATVPFFPFLGTSGNDTYVGTSVGEVMFGLDGNDSINGGGGDDSISGGWGSDTIDGGTGTDTVSYQYSIPPVSVSLALAVAQNTLGEGTDLLKNIENLIGSPNGDTLTGSSGANVIDGNSGYDLINGGAGDDTLIGNWGDDTIIGGEGFDVAKFAGTIDQYIVGRTGATVTVMAKNGSGVDSLTAVERLQFDDVHVDFANGTSGDDSIVGTSGSEILSGFEGNDTLAGSGGADTLFGGEGNDTLYSASVSPAFSLPFFVPDSPLPTLDDGSERDSLVGGAGDDKLFAGYGDDVDGSEGYDQLFISFMGATGGVQADFRNAGSSDVFHIAGGTISDVDEVTWVSGSDFGDFLAPGSSYYSSFGSIFGRGGNDTIVAAYGTGWVDGGDGDDSIDAWNSQYGPHLFGGAGNDTMQSGAGGETHGGDGNDVLSGGTLYGDAGDDSLAGGGMLDGGDGNDTIVGSLFSVATLVGGAGNDFLVAGKWGDALSGGDGDDTQDGAGGNDSIDGGAGNDVSLFHGVYGDYVLTYDSQVQRLVVADSVANRDGTDTVTGVEAIRFTDGDFTIESIVAMFGTAGSDVYDGSAEADTYNGMAGNDTISGNAGDDTLTGGDGNDVIDGGEGSDTAAYKTAPGTVIASLAIEGAQNTFAGGIDTLANVENLVGGSSGDGLTGNDGANRLDGGGGNDLLDGGAGADTLVGGTGDDTFVVDSSDDVVVEQDAQGTDTVRSSASFVLAQYVENLTLTGDEAIDGTGNSQANVIVGNGAANTLLGLGGADQINGGGGDNNIAGGDDADTADGEAGSDFVDGGSGNDTVIGGDGADTLVGGEGNDTLFSSQAAGTYWYPYFGIPGQRPAMDTGSDVDLLFGGAGDDKIFAGYGDWVDGGSTGSDVLLISFLGAAHGVDADFRPLVGGGVVEIDGATVQNVDAIGWLEGSDYGDLLAVGNSDLFAPIYGLGGNDTIVGAYITGAIDGGEGNDSIDAGHTGYGFDVHGGAGDDTIVSGSNGTVYGDEGDDFFVADNGANISGGAGTDTASFSWDRTTFQIVYYAESGSFSVGNVIVRSDVEYLQFADGKFSADEFKAIKGTESADSMSGTAASDRLLGLAGNDTLLGLAGDDTLNGGAGNDKLDGGIGVDTASYEGAAAGVKVSLLLTTSQVTGGAGSDILLGIENLVGSDFNDTLTGSKVANRIDGGAGNDAIDGSLGADTMSGGAGNDSYKVDSAGDVVVEQAGQGIDLVTSTVSFTLGANVENLMLGGSAVATGAGNELDNVITGNAAANVLVGLGGNDTLAGAGGNDSLTGGEGNDSIDGGAGVDTMSGGAGDDTYVIDNVGDLVVEADSSGHDTVVVKLLKGTFTLGSNLESAVLGGTGALAANGNALDNLIVGNTGANTIKGMDGNDTLDGGAGVDLLTGGVGADVFTFSAVLGTRNADKIADFHAGEDVIALSHIMFPMLPTGALAASAFQAQPSSVAQTADAHIIFNTATGALLYDADGAGGTVAVQFATVVLTGLSGTLSAADFTVT
ncbi:MAG TPA: calcium-binding protein [Ramlibacter sp.]|nr:calcium-binding protein [Ramlibacter sp.]